MFEQGLRKPLRWLAGGFILILLVASAAYITFFYHIPNYTADYRDLNTRDMQIAEASPDSYADNLNLLARVIQGEAGGEPFTGKVAVGAVMLNRVNSSAFPKSISGVIFDPDAFESVSNGLIWRYDPTWDSIQAASAAMSGWDPSYGSLFFWNPSKPVSAWIWSRQIITQIGNHVFAR